MRRSTFAGGACAVAVAGLLPLFADAAASTLVVYHVGNYVTTDIALSPSELLRFPGVRKRVVTSQAAIAAVRAAVAAAGAMSGSTGHDVDVRWGLVFTGGMGAPSKIFCDKWGKAAIVDGKPMTFAHPTLGRWLAAHYGPA